MKKFLKENWFKIGILIAIFYIAYSFYYNPSPKQIEKKDMISLNQSLKTSFDGLSQSTMAIAELFCFPTSRYDCTSEGCKPNTPATYYFVDYGLENGTYFRCDTKGCDSYPVRVVPSGSFTQFIPLEGRAMLFKVASDDPLLADKQGFVDVATIGTQTIISFGKCNKK